MNLAAGAITSFSDFMTVLCVAQDSRPECRHRAARVPAVVATPLGHRRDAHGAKYPAMLYVIERYSSKQRPPTVADSWVKSG
jgi:hypothetical protein